MPQLKHIYPIFFLIIIFLCGAITLKNGYSSLKTSVKEYTQGNLKQINVEIENQVNEALPKRRHWINLYGLVQKILLASGSENAQNIDSKLENAIDLAVNTQGLIRDKDGFLHVPYVKISKKQILEYADNLESIYRFAQQKKIPFLYVQAPSDYLRGKTELPKIWEFHIDSSNTQIDRFLAELQQRGIPCIDGRELIRDFEKEDIFYKTDHHWALRTSFAHVQQTIETLNRKYGLSIDADEKIRNLNNYTKKVYPRSFLGSRGVNVGEFYAGKDDFSIYYPKFETNLHYQHYVKGTLDKETKGDFNATFIDKTKLIPSFYNKYSAFLYDGWYENKIKNLNDTTNTKSLIIADSFGRSYTAYLSLCFSQTVFLDPQLGRFNSNVLAYIEKYKPDVIVVMFNGLGI